MHPQQDSCDVRVVLAGRGTLTCEVAVALEGIALIILRCVLQFGTKAKSAACCKFFGCIQFAA
jgi:hypothetical protein